MSLFLKIFLWFWGAMAILVLALLTINVTTRDDLVIPPTRGLMIDALAGYGRGAVISLEAGGDAELQKYLGMIEQRKKVRVYLFDPFGNERGTASQRPSAPADVRELARKTSFGIDPQFELSNSRVIAAQPVLSSRGTYVFCGAVSRNLLSAYSAEPGTQFLQFATIFLITGLFCFGVARFLASPVGRIRMAAQRITAGDLSARVQKNRFPRGHDELAKLAKDFDKMADRMEALVTAQNRLLGDVSHELRSPLTRMNLALELARRGDAAKKEAAFARIEREAGRLDELIGELLTLSRLENGLPSDKLNQNIDIAFLLQEIEADAEFEAKGGGRGVHTQYVGPEEGVFVRGDGELLRRAIENLTRNALKHTYDNSTVTLELKSDGDLVLIGVKDGGPGVPDEELKAIFRPFYRVETARDREQSVRGTGLGLAIAERAVSAHGGQIQASNNPEGGLYIQVELPKRKESRFKREPGFNMRSSGDDESRNVVKTQTDPQITEAR
jgi:signal transduction histidine kinase